MLVFLSPRTEGKRVTLHSLQFAQSAMNIRNRSRTNAITAEQPSIRAEFGAIAPDDGGETETDGAAGDVDADADAETSPQLQQWLALKP
jgi:hypothetical protein